MLMQTGYRKLALKIDSDPAMLALKEAVRGLSDVEIVVEEAPVGDHQANGALGNAAKNAQGQFRVSKDALASKCDVDWAATAVSTVLSNARGVDRRQESSG